MRNHRKTLLILSVAWALAVLLRFLFYHELKGLWLFLYLIDALYFVAALILVIFHILQKKVSSLVTILGMAIIAYVFFFTSVGWKTGTVFRFLRMQSSYEVQVAEILELSDAEAQDLPFPVQVDLGPPRRIAFSWGGIIDNWSGIVYDPSGEVLRAREFKKDWSNWGDPELRHVKRLFGGDMRYSFHLWGDWYYCSFT